MILGSWRLRRTFDICLTHIDILKVLIILFLPINMLINRIKNLVEFNGNAICHISGIQWVLLQLNEFIQRMIDQFQKMVLGLC